MILSFTDARAAILREIVPLPTPETVPLAQALQRVLALPLLADRDIPALDRSVRDGYAVRAADLPGPLPITATIRAGDPPSTLPPHQAHEIMTGAPLPQGADAVLMIEHAVRTGDHLTHPAVPVGTFISRRAEEAHQSQTLIPAGTRLDPTHIALLAACGHPEVTVYRKPTVALLATGDELVAIETIPLPHQVRNSNAHALAAQVHRAGGIPQLLPIAPDDPIATRALIEQSLHADLLLLSGGVSAGKFDYVEQALAELGATFHFDRALIQPGAPVVFGHVQSKPFFGLPGNPASTYVTFELFARLALDLLSGQRESHLRLSYALLTVPYKHKPGLTRFLPAHVSPTGHLTPIKWRGSADLPSLARANAFLIADPAREQWNTGDLIPLLWK